MRRIPFQTAFVALAVLALSLPGVLAVTTPAAAAASGASATSSSAPPASPAALAADAARPGAIDHGAPSASTSAAPAATGITPAATATYTFGQQPLADVVAAATNQAKCSGLTTNMLAAIVLAPTYPETGASGSLSPSPMTLSRYDSVSVNPQNANLYFQGNPSTPYQRAFWNPGVGPWQFDSAGGWPLSTAQEMNTHSASIQAASVMASAYCNAIGSGKSQHDARAAAWSPWACGTSTCENIYQTIYTPGSPDSLNVHTDSSVTSTGGMVATTCLAVNGTSVPCSYINPAAAQGDSSFAVPGVGTTPISAPFYDYVLPGTGTGTEYRVWSSADTGYPQTIYAALPIGANARDSSKLAWGTTGNPFGNLESVVTGPGEVQVSGWAIDPDTSTPISMQAIIDGGYPPSFSANVSRPDVGAAFPGSGNDHGFSDTLNLTPGTHTVCVWALNDTTGPNTLLGCKTVTIGGSPFGNLESVVTGPDQVEVNGWAIDPDVANPDGMVLYVDGGYDAPFNAGGTRTDVGAAFPLYGSNHGFSQTFNLSPGTHSVCVWALNNVPGPNTQLGCRTVTIGGVPFGNFESMSTSPGAVVVSGWAIDPDTSGAAQVVVDLDGVWHGQFPATVERDDVGGAYPLYGVDHGYHQSVGVPSGSHTICMWVLNVGAGSTNTLLGCRGVVVPAS